MLRNLLGYFRRRSDVIGMDLAGPGVRFVKLLRGKDGSVEKVSQWHYEGSFPRDSESDSSSFRGFLAANHLVGSKVACNIEDDSLKIRKVDLPDMPASDLKEALRWQLRETLADAGEDYVIRYSPLEEYLVGDVKKISVIAYAIRKTAVRTLVARLKKNSLIPVLVEPTSVALLSVFNVLQGWKEREMYGLIELGESRSLFTTMGDGRLYFSRPLPGIAGPALKDSKQIAVECQRSLDAFSLLFQRERVHGLFLSGVSLQPDLRESLSQALAVKTEFLEGSSKFPMSLATNNEHYNVALGLALYQA